MCTSSKHSWLTEYNIIQGMNVSTRSCAHQLGDFNSSLSTSDKSHWLTRMGKRHFPMVWSNIPHLYESAVEYRRHRSWPAHSLWDIYQWQVSSPKACTDPSWRARNSWAISIMAYMHQPVNITKKQAASTNVFTNLMCIVQIKRVTSDNVRKHHPGHGHITCGECSLIRDIVFG